MNALAVGSPPQCVGTTPPSEAEGNHFMTAELSWTKILPFARCGSPALTALRLIRLDVVGNKTVGASLFDMV